MKAPLHDLSTSPRPCLLILPFGTGYRVSTHTLQGKEDSAHGTNIGLHHCPGFHRSWDSLRIPPRCISSLVNLSFSSKLNPGLAWSRCLLPLGWRRQGDSGYCGRQCILRVLICWREQKVQACGKGPY